MVLKLDPYTKDYVRTKVNVWNPTVANLTLMALGSSAPEILLNTIETVSTLGDTPGELGPSTIVGSAAFNFLMITGFSIYAVNEANDGRSKQEIESSGTVRGVKKVNDTGVFAITTVWSIIAYIWLYIVLSDGFVEEWEAYLTLGFFFILIIMAYIADCVRRKKQEKLEEEKALEKAHQSAEQGPTSAFKGTFNNVRTLEVIDFYSMLVPLEQGKEVAAKDQQVTNEMREFLQAEFGTTKVSEVDKELLKIKLNGPALIERVGYRQAVSVNSKKEAIAKGAVLRRENKSASRIDDALKNTKFGFSCLHYSVSEAAGALRIKVFNKSKSAGSVHFRTVDGDAVAGEDYVENIDKLEFKSGQSEAEIVVQIIDDEGWEPDEDFYVELYDAATGNRLIGEDTRTRITILDDDKPGMLVFEEKKALRHPANESECKVVVNRVHGTDGEISVKYKTVLLGANEHQAKPGIDFEPVEGVLTFKHTES